MKRRACFNCKAPRDYPGFCNDCWRMAILSSILGGSASELTHKVLALVLGP